MCYSVKGRAMLKAKALMVFDAKLARFEERLEKLVKVMEGIRKEIKKNKLVLHTYKLNGKEVFE